VSAAVSDSAQRSSKIRHTRARVHLLAPPSLAVLRVLRVEADPSGAKPHGEPPYAFLSGGWVYPIANTVASLGRGLRNDATLLDPAASREHARLLCEPDGWWIENRSSHALRIEKLAYPSSREVTDIPPHATAQVDHIDRIGPDDRPASSMLTDRYTYWLTWD